MTAQLNIPKLRFPEFKGEWNSMFLGELLEFKNGINAPKEQYGKGIKFINVLDILNSGTITYEAIIGSVDIDEDTLDKYPVRYGDVLFQRSSETREEVGTASVYIDSENTATFGGFVIRGRKKGEYDPYFLVNALKSDSVRDNITSRSGGSTRFNVGQEVLSSISVALPSLLEQTKIASFLSKVDEKITLLKKKKELLEQYKKGMMQKIFSQEVRFKPGGRTDEKGEEFPDWEEKILGQATFVNPSSKAIPEKFIYIDLESVKGGALQKINTILKDEAPSRAQRVLKRGDILFQMVRPYQRNNFYFDFDGHCVASTGYSVLRTKENAEFIYQYIHTNEFVDKVLEKCTGTNYPAINSTDLASINISVPSYPEQTKIANFLSAIDKKITHTQTQIDKAEQWKKGLLQQMFV